MLIRNAISLLAVSVLASAAFAGEDMQHKMKIAVVDGSGDDEVRIELDSDELDFDLHDMQVGENQAIVDSQGRNILVTREENGFVFDIEGKSIRLPVFDADHDRVWVEKSDVDADVDVHVVHDELNEGDGHNVKIIKKKIEIETEGPEA